MSRRPPEPGSLAASRLGVTSLHAEPTRRSEQITEAILGERLLVRDRRGESGDCWLEVEGRDAYPGWVPASHLASVGASWPGERAVKIGALSARVRASDGGTIRRVVFGACLERLGEEEGRIAVRLPGGEEGWVEPAALAVFHDGLSGGLRAFLESVGASLSGVPYRWGGRSVLGLDCSGLVQLVYAELGVSLPRDSHLMEAYLRETGERVERGRERPGDLLFWGREERATHVGVALDRDRFLHARGWVRVGTRSSGPDADLEEIARGAHRSTLGGFTPGVSER